MRTDAADDRRLIDRDMGIKVMAQAKCRGGIDGGKGRNEGAETFRRYYDPSLNASLNKI